MNIWEAAEKKFEALNLSQHEPRPELEEVISQYVPELINAGRNAEKIHNILLHFSDEVEAAVHGK